MVVSKLLELLVIIVLLGAIVIAIVFKIAENVIDFAEANPLTLLVICLIIVALLFVSL